MKFPEEYRWTDAPHPYGTSAGEPYGMFRVPGRAVCGRALKIIANDGQETGWDHVSVSLPDWPNRCPSWEEMCAVKTLFWDDSECVVQFHPATENYVNTHTGCLHLWKYLGTEFPTPPTICV